MTKPRGRSDETVHLRSGGGRDGLAPVVFIHGVSMS